MANGKRTLTGSISSGQTLTGSVKGGSGTTDHSRLINRANEDQHPIEAITALRSELDSKLDSTTALPLIEEALQGKAKGLYFDALKELARKSYWYLTAEVDPKTGLGTKNSIISGPYDLGMGGGGGGGGGVTTVAIKPVNWPQAASVGNVDTPTKITVTWSSVIGEDRAPTGAGTLYLSVNGKQVEVRSQQPQGEAEFDISQYLISGSNTIQVKVLDMYGTTGITVGVITGVSLELKSSFSQDSAFYGKVDFTYTPVGNVTKTVYFVIDGDEAGAKSEIVKSSNELQTYTISGLSHGSHTLKVYFEADISGQIVSSNTLFYDITVVEDGNPKPIIASEFNKFIQEQYISFSIPYRVFIDKRSMATVTFEVNGEVLRTSEVTTNGTHVWAYRFDGYTAKLENGELIHTADPLRLKISCSNAGNYTEKSFEITVVESKITVTPVLNNLELALSANGKSNGDLENREKWSYNDINCTFTNFNWKSDGWVIDKLNELGNPAEGSTTVLRVGGAARVEIPLKVFESDCIAQNASGKTIEIEMATHGIRNYESTIISCLDEEKTPFYTVESLYVDEDDRLKGYEISYIYSTLSDMIKETGKYYFTYNGTNWTLDGKVADLNDYGIKLTEITLNTEGKYTGSVLKGDQIFVNFTMESRGFEVTPQVASIRSQQSFLSTQYKEDEHVRISFVVEPGDADHNRIIWMYINGVASGAMQWTDGDSFKQKVANCITIGSSEAIVDIYSIRIYNSALTNRQIVNNWIADTTDASLKASRFNHNQVLNEQDQVTPASLSFGAQDLPYIIWDIDELPTTKDAKVGNAEYVDPSDPARNFTAIDAEYKVQGTSSAVYPTKNIRLRTKKGKGGPNLEWYDEEGNDLIIKNGGKGFPITYPNGIGVDYFTFKVDYASSEGANNVELTKLYNDVSKAYGLLTPPQITQPAGSKINPDQVRVGIDGFPIVAFHRDAADNISFCTKANFNNDKGNEEVYGFATGDESWETTNNSAAVTKYQKPVTVENFEEGFEIRFPDKDDYNDMSKLGPMTAWVYSTYRDEAKKTILPEVKTYPIKTAVITDESEEDKTFRYNYELKFNEDGEQEFDALGNPIKVLTSVTFTHDSSDYRLNKFKHELSNLFNVDSCLFYYLFTELFLMIDSRAKNAFPTYFATRTKELVKDDDGNEMPNTYTDGGNRWYWIPYDMDTAIGIDNKGKLTFDYYLEDIDHLEGGADVYNGQTSVMWCNVRDAFKTELADMYAKLRAQKLLSYDEVERRFEEHQGKWPEVILNLDSYNKYVVPLKNKSDNYLEMLQGTKVQQRKWWLYNRFKYMDSKYNAGDAKADFIQFRAYVDIGKEKPDIELIPYANIYATASFGNGDRYTVVERALNRGEKIVLKNPFGLADDENDQETYIYSASQLKSIGDIAPFYPDTVKIGNAVRLQELKVGDDGEKYPGYRNPYLKELTVGANTLLRTLDARNCVNLGTGTTTVPDLSKCTNIEEIYFTGTKIKGVKLPDGGTITKLHLPGTLNALTIQNQPLLEELKLENTNTTITKGSTNEDNYVIVGFVVKKDPWSETNANGSLYLADSLDIAAPQIRVSIANKALYEELERESKLIVTCKAIDIRYDLINDTEIQLAEYSTRRVESNGTGITEDTTVATNISTIIAVVAEKIEPPELKDFKTSLIERLWLEGIPSKAIKAKEFIENMKEGTEVRLININETYEDTYVGGVLVKAWEQVKKFYDLLDRHKGINFSNSPTAPKAQVTGVINIDEISYRDYIELTARYPEVTINAKQIICTIQFYNKGHYEHGQYIGGKLYKYVKVALKTSLDSANKLVIAGKTVFAPLNPTKEPTQSHSYEFDKWLAQPAVYSIESGWGYPVVESEEAIPTWTEDYLIFSDMRIDAKYLDYLQEYTVVFDTDSDLISIDEAHRNLVVEYGSTLSRPQLLNVPTTVDLAGWYPTEDYSGYPWVFNDDDSIEPVNQVLGPVTLKAKWDDGTVPTISIRRLSYNTFNFEVRDNLGITGWAVVKDSVDAPTSWNTVKSTTYISDAYEIDSAGEYYFWISDISGNTATQKVTAYSINVNILESDGHTPVHKYSFIEGENTFRTNFALADTILKFVLDEDPHYKDLSVEIDAALADSLDTFIVAQDVAITIGCTPKDYTVTFVTGKEFDGVRVASQTITYRHKPEKPLALYHAGYIINAWYTDSAVPKQWDFDTDVVEGDTFLYAEWREYRVPTKIKIKIPHNFEDLEDKPTSDADYDPYKITVYYTQEKANSVKVKFGDSDQEFSTATTTYVTSVEHTYAEPGEYIVEIYGTPYGYSLGGDYNKQTVDPACCITDIDFAWDVSTTREYAFKGAQIESLKLTPYMTTIARAAFAACRKLKTFTIPSSIYMISSQAFENCSGLTGDIVIPKNISEVGVNVFNKCTNLDRIIFEENGKLHEIGAQFAFSSGIKDLVVPQHIQHIAKEAFGNCVKLEKVVLLNPDLTMDEMVFNAAQKLKKAGPIGYGGYAPGENPNFNLEFAWTEKIPDYAFSAGLTYRQSYFESITLPETITEIGDAAFRGTAIKQINLPASLKTIGENAFYYTALLELDVPAAVTFVGARAFGFNSSLNDAVLRFGGSINTINAATDGWFFGCDASLTPKIPLTLYQRPDFLAEQYGQYWNVYAYNNDTFEAFFLNYTVI